MDASTQRDQQHGPYDVAMYIARSFGRALPIVVIVALISAGSWYFIKELSTLQTRLIEAEQKLSTAKVDQAKAESAAQSAIDRARGEIMTEQAKQIGQLNDASVTVSKRIQELVSGQLENMSRLEASSKSQVNSAIAQQKDAEAAAKTEIATLKKQLDQLESRRKEVEAAIALGGYQEIQTKLIEELSRGYYFSSSNPLLDLLRPRLSDLQLRPVILAETRDSRITWRYRLLLLVELYRLSGDDTYFNQIGVLLDANKAALDRTAGQIFSGRTRWSTSAEEPIAKLALKWILDDSAPIAARLSFFDLLPYGDGVDRYVWNANFSDKEKATKGLGRLLLAVTEIGDRCDQSLDLLRRFSSEAVDAFSSHLLSSAQFSKGHECVTSYYKRWGNTVPRVDEAVVSRWLAQ